MEKGSEGMELETALAEAEDQLYRLGRELAKVKVARYAAEARTHEYAEAFQGVSEMNAAFKAELTFTQQALRDALALGERLAAALKEWQGLLPDRAMDLVRQWESSPFRQTRDCAPVVAGTPDAVIGRTRGGFERGRPLSPPHPPRR